ncbi:MFS transporter [Schleiferilactobacillus shenzhenensis]|uniref:YxiO n=1 Tax=Schleiferilactobacillus shenzhenensis LY-73 TaxID=1231336 RepID=U4TQX6_9LACO|nr:MFS transporter [Schleiferilactobacillus shenzhenensis]ERL65845.1 YxiO [Schleiferilactobacillus shenzhenensis LY-73]
MHFTKQEKSWMMYDWSNSAYGIVIVTAILPIYFKAVATGAGVTAANSTAYWGYANSISTLVVALLAPVLGAIADYRPFKRMLFIRFTALGIIATACLPFVPQSWWGVLLAVFVISNIGYSGANIFYDGFLTDVTDADRMDRVSANGFALGYLGGVIPFIVVMVLELTKGFGVMDQTMIVRFAFFLSALWWLVFAFPMWRNVHQTYYLDPVDHPVRASWHRVRVTTGRILKNRPVALFLLSYFLYIDGVDTIFSMATAIGVDMGLSSSMLMVVLLLVQLIAVPFSVLYGRAAQRFGTKPTLLVALGFYAFITLYAFFLHDQAGFWFLAVLIGMNQGGIQSVSRSHYARLIPKQEASEYFGFYNIFGQFSAIFGPLLVGVVTQLTGRSTVGASSLFIFFLIGFIIFLYVPKQTAGDASRKGNL